MSEPSPFGANLPLETRDCQSCGEPFSTRYPDKQVCSAVCLTALHREAVPKTVPRCRDCGKMLRGETSGGACYDCYRANAKLAAGQ